MILFNCAFNRNFVFRTVSETERRDLIIDDVSEIYDRAKTTGQNGFGAPLLGEQQQGKCEYTSDYKSLYFHFSVRDLRTRKPAC
jgi:hypothetical protein